MLKVYLGSSCCPAVIKLSYYIFQQNRRSFRYEGRVGVKEQIPVPCCANNTPCNTCLDGHLQQAFGWRDNDMEVAAMGYHHYPSCYQITAVA